MDETFPSLPADALLTPSKFSIFAKSSPPVTLSLSIPLVTSPLNSFCLLGSLFSCIAPNAFITSPKSVLALSLSSNTFCTAAALAPIFLFNSAAPCEP